MPPTPSLCGNKRDDNEVGGTDMLGSSVVDRFIREQGLVKSKDEADVYQSVDKDTDTWVTLMTGAEILIVGTDSSRIETFRTMLQKAHGDDGFTWNAEDDVNFFTGRWNCTTVARVKIK